MPQKRKSKWILTVAPLCLLVFGLGAHFYFFATAGHGRVHIGTKILLSTLWISGFCSYILALHHFKFKDQEYVRTLNRNDWLYVNVAFYTGIFAVSFVLFEDAYYQVIFDLVNIKKTITRNCDHHGHRRACDAVFYTLATSVYWGLYSAVVVCCVFLCVCLSTCNTLTKGYAQIEKSTDDVRGVLKYYSELRQDVEEIMNSIKVWFSVHLLFYVLVLIANIYEWCEAATIFHHPYQYTAQIAETLVVAYKFFFPFISASYVTWHELNLAHALNDKVDYENNQTFYCRQSLEIFLKQSKRRGYGFRLYNIQITITIAIFSLLGSIVGLAHNFLHIRTAKNFMACTLIARYYLRSAMHDRAI